ncbi:MAG: hypothetical protein AB4352_24800 [Hormoscilla sp.]
MTPNIDVTGLKQEQIAQINAIIEAFQAKNTLDSSLRKKAPSSEITVETDAEDFDISTRFFESEILPPYNRSILYGKRT